MLRPGGGVETRPTPQCRVKIRTEGKLDNGTVIDKYSSVPFTLGDGDVIQGGRSLETSSVPLNLTVSIIVSLHL